MKEKVFITGATGFTGGYLFKELVNRGYPVRALVRNKAKAKHLEAENVELVEGDLRDAEFLKQALDSIHTVYHIAAIFRQENLTEDDMFAVNVEGTRNMLDAAVAANVARFVHCSTVGVHGAPINIPADESADYNPGDHYQRSKVEGEKVAIEYMKKADIPVTIFRPGPGIYGPGEMRFLKMYRGVQKGRFIMFGSGEIHYQFIYIDDLVDGIIKCGTLDQAVGQIYILSGNEAVTLNEMTEIIADAVGSKPPRLRFPVMPLYYLGWVFEILYKPFGAQPPIFRRRVDFFRKDRAFKIDKARNELGYNPVVNTREGFMRTAAWYKENGYL
ncbi:MAG: NAD-dependent epimerase/dehydratase family protein [Chloroflexota bacterium]